MLRYKLRTLLILLAILPPLLWLGWTKYEAWRAERERQRWEEIVRLIGEDSAEEVKPQIQPAESLDWSDLMIGKGPRAD